MRITVLWKTLNGIESLLVSMNHELAISKKTFIIIYIICILKTFLNKTSVLSTQSEVMIE